MTDPQTETRVDEPVGSEEPGREVPSPAPARRGSGVTVFTSVLATLCIPLIVIMALLFGQMERKNSAAQARSDATSTARQVAENFLSFDYRHIDAELNRINSESTGAFKADLARTRSALVSKINQNQVVNVATIREAGVVSSSSKEAEVLVAADVTLKDKTLTQGTLVHYRIQMHVVKAGGKWLVENVSPVT